MKLGDVLKGFPRARAAAFTVALTSVGGVLGWLGTTTLKNLEEVERMAVESKARIERLENDDAKWGTLAEQQKSIVELRIEIEVLKRLYGHPRTARAAFKDDDADESPAADEEAPAPVEKPDLDRFKNMQQQRYGDKK